MNVNHKATGLPRLAFRAARLILAGAAVRALDLSVTAAEKLLGQDNRLPSDPPRCAACGKSPTRVVSGASVRLPACENDGCGRRVHRAIDALTEPRGPTAFIAAFGAELDRVGAFYNVKRGTDDDVTYRARITEVAKVARPGPIGPTISDPRTMNASSRTERPRATSVATRAIGSSVLFNGDRYRIASTVRQSYGVQYRLERESDGVLISTPVHGDFLADAPPAGAASPPAATPTDPDDLVRLKTWVSRLLGDGRGDPCRRIAVAMSHLGATTTGKDWRDVARVAMLDERQPADQPPTGPIAWSPAFPPVAPGPIPDLEVASPHGGTSVRLVDLAGADLDAVGRRHNVGRLVGEPDPSYAWRIGHAVPWTPHRGLAELLATIVDAARQHRGTFNYPSPGRVDADAITKRETDAGTAIAVLAEPLLAIVETVESVRELVEGWLADFKRFEGESETAYADRLAIVAGRRRITEQLARQVLAIVNAARAQDEAQPEAQDGSTPADGGNISEPHKT